MDSYSSCRTQSSRPFSDWAPRAHVPTPYTAVHRYRTGSGRAAAWGPTDTPFSAALHSQVSHGAQAKEEPCHAGSGGLAPAPQPTGPWFPQLHMRSRHRTCPPGRANTACTRIPGRPCPHPGPNLAPRPIWPHAARMQCSLGSQSLPEPAAKENEQRSDSVLSGG